MKKTTRAKTAHAKLTKARIEGQSKPVRVLIMGAAGRDFHNFNVFFRGNRAYKVVAFTATQIPGIEGRRYPRELAGAKYPKGIPIYPEEQLLEIVKKEKVDEVVFAYSDVSHEYVMHKASTALAAGPDFRLMGGKTTMLKSKKPIVSICAVRTGSGKSQTSRAVARILQANGYRVVAVRHPMPYGDLKEQACERFATLEDLDKYRCTIEEREEYEAYVVSGMVIYAGVDYGQILSEAEKEADIIIWDGGNNDLPFYKPDLQIVVADPYRPGHELKYHPGEANLRMADVVLINKVNTADPKDVETVKKNVHEVNPNATIIIGASTITVDNDGSVKGKKVLVIEDGPTVTHGGMPLGAGTVAAQTLGAAEIVDPRPYAFGSIHEAYKKYPHMTKILPALGYGDIQVKELEKTINAIPCDLVVIGTPIDLRNVLTLNKPAVRAKYELQEHGSPNLQEILTQRYPKK
ncbi:MAG TPA: cyclic 2,3-diphosphoglycerate synthase [Candidatus Acidoferrales bacterium]|nr:cyclic 2,3-diphosphoglycerate synthase [Candidatus Acidoferrales bacterium]